MTDRTDDELENLLRRTYREVANRTQADSERPGVPTGTSPASTSRHRWLLAAAAALVMVGLGAVAVVGTRGSAPSDAIGTGDLVHALPTAVPLSSAAAQTRAGMPVALISSSPTADTIRYEADDLTVTLTVHRGASEAGQTAGGTPVTIRNGHTAALTAEADGRSGELFWADGGLETTISWNGSLLDGTDEIIRMADGLVYVDDADWATRTAHAGFGAPNDAQIMRRRLPGGANLSLEGTLRNERGLSYRIGNVGSTITAGACSVQFGFDVDGWSVVARSTDTTAHVTFADGDQVDVVLEPMFPGAIMSVGTFRTDADPALSPQVTCAEGAS